LNNSNYGLLSFAAHGTPKELLVTTTGINGGRISSLFSLFNYSSSWPNEAGGLDQTTNFNHPGVFYSVGCDLMPFDDPPGYASNYNWGESYTVLGEYGGVSMIGNTRLGSGYSIELFRNFLSSEFPNPSLNLNLVSTTDYSLYSSEIGYHFWKGKSNYVGLGDYHYVILSTNLLGCPQTEYWRSTPQQFSGISITDNGTSITVNTNNNSKCLISVTSVNPTASYQEIVFDETAHTFTTSIRPLQITITKHFYESSSNKADYIPYQAITGGTLTSNTKFYNQLNVLNNLTISNGVTLTVEPGAKLNFINGSSLIVNGTLTSNGTTTNKVTFDFISPNSTTQNGIRVYTGATLNVSNTIVKRAWYGIYCNYTYASPINNWEITECNTGIYFSSTPIGISNNYIHNNSMGIALYNSSPTLTLNKITANTNYGVSSSGSTSIPKFGNGSTQGKNKITGNPVGVCAFSNSLPMLGNNSPINGGYNTFGENTNYNVYALTSGVIYARNNYWGSIPPVSNKIWISSGVILYSPYLYSDPTGLSKAVPTVEDAVLALLTKAMNLIEQKNLLAAREICLDIINNYSDSYAAFNALSLLTQTFDLGEKETTKLNYKTLFNKDKQRLNAVAGLILAELDKENKLKAIDEVISKFTGDAILEDALFAKFLYYYNDIQDKENARLVSNELEKLFPNSISSIDAHHHLGDKDYLQKTYSFLKTVQEQKQIIVSSPLPEDYNLFANYPNPFNPTTVIKYALPFASNVNVTVYNTLGQIVKEFYEGTKEAGYYSVNFTGENLSSGVYMYSLNAISTDGKQNFNATKKMLLLK